MDRQAVIDDLKRKHIWSVFHYVPLHSSPAGQRYGRAHGNLAVTDRVATTLLRLPMWTGLEAVQEQVIDALSISLTAQERQA
jgi:dTDP-4-amino-4,6-dideoxygalactose transaminase